MPTTNGRIVSFHDKGWDQGLLTERDNLKMDDCRIVVVGLGSMGRRRIGILRRLYPGARISGVDERPDRRESLNRDLGLKAFRSLSEVFHDIPQEVLFACSSPLSHASIVQEGLTRGCHTFSELNLSSDGYKRIQSLAKEKGKVAFLSSTQLYRQEIEASVTKIREMGGSSFYSYHVGQYLPDWHPWEKVEDFFVRDPRTNGCREIFAIELPWMVRCFGEVRSFEVTKKKMTGLSIGYPDTYICLFEHYSGIVGTMTVDLVSRNPVRHLEVTSEKGTLSWDGTPDSLQYFSPEAKKFLPLLESGEFHQDPRYSRTIIEDAYEKEIQAFQAAIAGDLRKVLHEYGDDARILDLIDRIEGADR